MLPTPKSLWTNEKIICSNRTRNGKNRRKRMRVNWKIFPNTSRRYYCPMQYLSIALWNFLFIDMRDVRYGRKGDEVGSQERGLRLRLSLPSNHSVTSYPSILPIPRLYTRCCAKKVKCIILEQHQAGVRYSNWPGKIPPQMEHRSAQGVVVLRFLRLLGAC